MSGVVQIVTSLERGGAQRIALETAAALHERERPQWLFTGAPAALDDEARARLGGRLVHVPWLAREPGPIGDALALVALHGALSRVAGVVGAPLVVHTHTSKAGVLGRLAARAITGSVVVHTVHGWSTSALGARARPLLEGMERIAGAATDVVIYVSDADRALAERARFTPRAKRRLIRAGVTPFARPFDDEERRAARARLRIDDDATLAVTVANLKPQKDPLFHVDVLAAWRARTPRARLLFVGDGPLRVATEARARALGVGGALALPGFLDDVSHVYAAGDVFLLASRWEGMPCAVLEALSAGLPVVVRDSGWAHDLAFTDRVIARPLGVTANELAAALDEALAEGRAPLTLPRSFTCAGMLEELDALYDELLATSSRAASTAAISSSVL